MIQAVRRQQHRADSRGGRPSMTLAWPIPVALCATLLAQSTMAQQPITLYAWNHSDDDTRFSVDGETMCSLAPHTTCSHSWSAGSHRATASSSHEEYLEAFRAAGLDPIF